MPTPTLQQVADAVIRRAQRQGYVVPSEVRSELRLAGLEETLWKDAVELGRASLIYKQGRYYHKAAVSPRLEQEQRQRQAIDKALRPLIRQYRRRAREQERRTQARIDYVQTVQIQPEDGAAFTLLTAASRVVLGLHYPSDVLAGAAIGAALAGLSFGI